MLKMFSAETKNTAHLNIHFYSNGSHNILHSFSFKHIDVLLQVISKIHILTKCFWYLIIIM